jgi:hypothetical protein
MAGGLPGAEGWQMGWTEKYGREMGTTDSFRLIPLTHLRRSGCGGRAFPFGAAKHAHWGILAQKAENVQVMMTTFFITRNPRKHWSKRVSRALLSSMYS